MGGIATVLATGLAYYLYWTNRDKISAVLGALLHYGSRLTYSELTEKLNRLGEMRADDKAQKGEIIASMGELYGQLQGNSELRVVCLDSLREIEIYLKSPDKLTEPTHRMLVARLRETLRQHEIAKLGGSGRTKP